MSWKDQTECQGCGTHREETALRAIKLKNSDRVLLCRECFEEKLNAGEVSPEDPRVD